MLALEPPGVDAVWAGMEPRLPDREPDWRVPREQVRCRSQQRAREQDPPARRDAQPELGVDQVV